MENPEKNTQSTREINSTPISSKFDNQLGTIYNQVVTHPVIIPSDRAELQNSVVRGNALTIYATCAASWISWFHLTLLASTANAPWGTLVRLPFELSCHHGNDVLTNQIQLLQQSCSKIQFKTCRLQTFRQPKLLWASTFAMKNCWKHTFIFKQKRPRINHIWYQNIRRKMDF